jgi:DNA-binding Xre family transcriptional regulator
MHNKFKQKSKLALLLAERGMNVKDLFRLLKEKDMKIEYYSLTQMVNGKRTNYTIQTLMRLCNALEVSPNDIVEHDATPLPHKKSYAKESVSQVQDNVDENGDDDFGF